MNVPVYTKLINKIEEMEQDWDGPRWKWEASELFFVIEGTAELIDYHLNDNIHSYIYRLLGE